MRVAKLRRQNICLRCDDRFRSWERNSTQISTSVSTSAISRARWHLFAMDSISSTPQCRIQTAQIHGTSTIGYTKHGSRLSSTLLDRLAVCLNAMATASGMGSACTTHPGHATSRLAFFATQQCRRSNCPTYYCDFSIAEADDNGYRVNYASLSNYKVLILSSMRFFLPKASKPIQALATAE